MREESVFRFTFVLPNPVLPDPSPIADPSLGTPATALSRLTQKEARVVALVSRGMTNKETARELGGISPHTVATHLRRAFVKLQVNNRDDLAGLIDRATHAN